MNVIKRFKWIGWIASLLLVIIVISMIYQLVDFKTGAVTVPNDKVNPPVTRTVFDHGSSKFSGLNLRTETE